MLAGKNAGEVVELAIRRQHISISALSRKMHVDRRTLYNWFAKKKLARNVILGIGIAINYDFSHELTQVDHIAEKIEVGSNLNMLPEDEKLLFIWMDRYMTLLESFKKLLEDLDAEKHI
ncbi:hypothetical protein [Pedobacter sp. MC2016-24]|uniref:hypothetical protein n=1 Tax=Pedobacter sp. MC2016-24 TaxID=2780090 RepID=UPI00188250CA|nr:hypothetical protein [Pedobacter sp. MC2016-24]MBE9601675.1 hypothetical protein [Pedobacter sp. MC2016-24]